MTTLPYLYVSWLWHVLVFGIVVIVVAIHLLPLRRFVEHEAYVSARRHVVQGLLNLMAVCLTPSHNQNHLVHISGKICGFGRCECGRCVENDDAVFVFF